MIIYREQKNETRPDEYLSRIRIALNRYEQNGFSEHSQAMEILEEFSEFETAVTDALAPDEDSITALKQVFRGASVAAGKLFYRSWEGIKGERGELVSRLRGILDHIAALALPHTLLIGMPEGFVYYGLYPETYLEAAKRFHEHLSPRKAVCIGLRNIGACLSAVVAATLEELGCETVSCTVRPRGHPFDRHLALSREMEYYISSLSGWYFLVIDEGPGLSGSSFGCTAQKISELGHSDKQIIFFPSWEPEQLGFASESTRDHWRRHRKFSADFNEVCLDSGKLFGALSGEFLDLSAGRWRTLFYGDPSDYPAVFPQHERRKFLSHNGFCRKVQGWRADVEPSVPLRKPARSSGCLLKFVGLGRYGRETRHIAELLANAGFSPPVVGLVNGFLVTRFVIGRPLNGYERNKDILDTIAQYFAFLKKSFPVARSTSYEQMREMTFENIRESMGETWIERLDILDKLYKAMHSSEATAIDGRMFPHEWIASSGAYLKTDGANHFNDHFFPGRQNIAWDMVATFVEFELNLAERKYLVQQYTRLTGDADILSRLPFYRIVYLSYRLGYASEAADALYATPDGNRFRNIAAKYGTLLRSEIVYITDQKNSRIPYGVLPAREIKAEKSEILRLSARDNPLSI